MTAAIAIVTGGIVPLTAVILYHRRALRRGAGQDELQRFRHELASLRHDIAELRESHADLMLMLHDAEPTRLPRPEPPRRGDTGS